MRPLPALPALPVLPALPMSILLLDFGLLKVSLFAELPVLPLLVASMLPPLPPFVGTGAVVATGIFGTTRAGAAFFGGAAEEAGCMMGGRPSKAPLDTMFPGAVATLALAVFLERPSSCDVLVVVEKMGVISPSTGL